MLDQPVRPPGGKEGNDVFLRIKLWTEKGHTEVFFLKAIMMIYMTTMEMILVKIMALWRRQKRVRYACTCARRGIGSNNFYKRLLYKKLSHVLPYPR
jgi:hypothetical protein